MTDTTTSEIQRRLMVDRLLADPPIVHAMDASPNPQLGLWDTDETFYRFVAEHCNANWTTLETGSGLSTLIFAATGATHICVTPEEDEVARLEAYSASKDISLDNVTFHVAPSHAVLPMLEGELDLVFIDGGHGFPMPAIDWFYGGMLLRARGLMIIDDLQLPATRSLMAFLNSDPRWETVYGNEKWRAFRKMNSGSLAEEWNAQPFFSVYEPGLKGVARQYLGPVKRSLVTSLMRAKTFAPTWTQRKPHPVTRRDPDPATGEQADKGLT